MTMRRVLNVAWTLVIEGLDEEGVKTVRAWLNAKPKTPAELAEEARRKRAAENRAAITDLSRAFSLAR